MLRNWQDCCSSCNVKLKTEPTLDPADQAEALEQVKELAEAGPHPAAGPLQKTASTALKILRGTVAALPDTAQLAAACSQLLPMIAKLLGLG